LNQNDVTWDGSKRGRGEKDEIGSWSFSLEVLKKE
jgi:hypothetical protein